MRWLRWAGCVAGLGCLAAVCCGAVREAGAASRIRTHRASEQKPGMSAWEQAEQAREALEATADADRTRADYTRVLDAYRTIYHTNPADLHAPSAIYSVAELLAEQGRSLHEPGTLKAAIAQFEFLRRQYPGSSLRVQSLLSEGQIAQNDLADLGVAREKYNQLLKEHPRSAQAEEARAALDSLIKPKDELRASIPQVTSPSATRSASNSSLKASQSQPTPGFVLPPTQQTSAPAPSDPPRAVAKQSRPAPLPEAVPTATDIATIDAQTRPSAAEVNAVKRSGKRALVTGIRHWSTANYTRVAIDLGESVTYEAARVPNPDRIYFDLHGTRLASELVGKSFAVTDDGFLKKIRPAQYSDEVTRVVLDVSDVAEYSAFLLPNPYRLIIDIHGRKQGSAAQQQEAASSAEPVDVPPPHTAPAVKSTPGRPVPNTIATRSTPADLVDLSQMPGRVDATSTPTSKPISAIVSGTDAAQNPAVTRDQTPLAAPHPDVPTPVTKLSSMARIPSTSKRTRRGTNKTADGNAPDATPARAATKLGDGETSLVRALGLKIGRIVIDPGHGGHDSGTLGADGIQEKDVVLDVALRLGKLLHDRLGADIIYTRSDDTFIPLETRTAIANKAQADLFLSIHANSSEDATARGVETYYLNFTSDPTALDVAARENAISDQSIHQLSDLVKKIALKDKISESREFADDVETSLYSGLQKGNVGLKNRGVKKAPFVVLIGANMPSILAEISFVTNPRDASQLRDPEYRQRVAESLYRGVARYEGGLSASHIATERAAVGQ
ncbi:MAG TPA: N-acetylmuramoyl-L-alanine amidase [Acidobacteriaceae bacterium]|jgi:N-acetylmuramoyl-L-alanine amidase|nr:N-acetylmuramoyl-L-alanine amidase [Acidobacteriaceae bacterium]